MVNIDALADPIIEMLGVGGDCRGAAGRGLPGAGEADAPVRHADDATSRWSPRRCCSSTRYWPPSPTRCASCRASITRIQSGARRGRSHLRLRRPPAAGARPTAAAPRPRPAQRGTLEFRDVCFSYEPGQPILTNIHLTVRSARPSPWSARTAAARRRCVGLLPRFYDPDHGTILIDGHDIRTVNLRSLRQQIGVVTQETILFDDTIYNNIAYGNRRRDAERSRKPPSGPSPTTSS